MGRIHAYDHHVHAPNRPSAVFITVGAALAVIGSFLPWIGTGASARSSYDVVDLVERLGFTPDGAMSWVLRVWPLAPLLLVLSAVAQWAPVGRTRRTKLTISSVLPLVGAVYVGGVATAVRFAPGAALLRVRAGPAVTVIGTAMMVAGVAWATWVAMRRRSSVGESTRDGHVT